MEHNDSEKKVANKDKIVRRIVFAICASLIIATVLFTASHSICRKYNDWWIKGNSLENVEEKYGEAKLSRDKPRNKNASRAYYYLFGNYFAYYIIDYEPRYLYVMEVDDKGTVIDVYREECRYCGL